MDWSCWRIVLKILHCHAQLLSCSSKNSALPWTEACSSKNSSLSWTEVADVPKNSALQWTDVVNVQFQEFCTTMDSSCGRVVSRLSPLFPNYMYSITTPISFSGTQLTVTKNQTLFSECPVTPPHTGSNKESINRCVSPCFTSSHFSQSIKFLLNSARGGWHGWLNFPDWNNSDYIVLLQDSLLWLDQTYVLTINVWDTCSDLLIQS